MSDPYAELAALARRERELATAGAVADLEALDAERRAIVAALPPQAPAAARPALEDAARAQADAVQALRAAMDAAARSLADHDRTRDAARAYDGPLEDGGATLKFSA